MNEKEAKEIIKNKERYECNGGDVRFCCNCLGSCHGDDPKLEEATKFLTERESKEAADVVLYPYYEAKGES